MILKNLIDNFKVFGIASQKVVTKLVKRAGEYAGQAQISQHNDSTILSYDGPESGTWRHGEILAGIVQVDNSFSGLDNWDVVPFVAILNDASEAFDGWYVYYPCSYGLGLKTMSNASFTSLLSERGRMISLYKNYNQFWTAGSSFRTAYVVFTKGHTSFKIYLQCIEGYTFTKDSEGNITHGDIGVIGINYTTSFPVGQAWIVDSSESNIACSSSNNVYEIINNTDITQVREEYDITDMGNSLSATISDLEAVTDTVDELEPLVDSLEDRVSAIESETISKYVSR